MFFEGTFEKYRKARKKLKNKNHWQPLLTHFASHLDLVTFYTQEHVKPGVRKG